MIRENILLYLSLFLLYIYIYIYTHTLTQSVSKQMQPINMMIYYWYKHNGDHLEHIQ